MKLAGSRRSYVIELFYPFLGMAENLSVNAAKFDFLNGFMDMTEREREKTVNHDHETTIASN